MKLENSVFSCVYEMFKCAVFLNLSISCTFLKDQFLNLFFKDKILLTVVSFYSFWFFFFLAKISVKNISTKKHTEQLRWWRKLVLFFKLRSLVSAVSVPTGDPHVRNCLDSRDSLHTLSNLGSLGPNDSIGSNKQLDEWLQSEPWQWPN